MSVSELAVEIIHPNDVSTQLDSSDSARLIDQDQSLLKSLHGADLYCQCCQPPIAMHIKHRAGDNERFWLSDNPKADPHDIECPLFSHKLTPTSPGNNDPYRISETVHFDFTERKRNKEKTRDNTKYSPKTPKLALKPLIERVFRHLYENSLASYYFGGTHDVGEIVRRIKQSESAKNLKINGTEANRCIFDGMKGLVMLKKQLANKALESAIWVHTFSRFENKAHGFLLDSDYYPSAVDIKNPKKKGPFLAVTVWGGETNPKCLNIMIFPIASRQVALPVVDIESRDAVLTSAAFIQSNRNKDNKLYLNQPFPSNGAITIEGEIIFGKRERRVVHQSRQ